MTLNEFIDAIKNSEIKELTTNWAEKSFFVFLTDGSTGKYVEHPSKEYFDIASDYGMFLKNKGQVEALWVAVQRLINDNEKINITLWGNIAKVLEKKKDRDNEKEKE